MASDIFTRLARLSLFLDAVQDDCLGPLGISFADYGVLRLLELEGPRGALAPGRLAETLVRTSGGMTKTVDRLERLGHVRRSADPADRRGVLVSLTPKGRRLCAKASAAYTDARRRVLAQLAPDEAAGIDHALDRLLEVFEADRAGDRAAVLR